MRGKFGVNTGRTEWLTPPDLLKSLGPFDLDPCTPTAPPWRTAKTMFSPQDDGLSQPWHGRIWLNPPYGNEIIHWMQRMAEHGHGMALVCARTETAWFQSHVFAAATALLFLRGRLHFYDITGNRARGNAGAPSVLCAYGESDAVRLQQVTIPGQYFSLKQVTLKQSA